MMRKWLTISVLTSILGSLLIFNYYAGVSGGDIAILIFIIFWGVFNIIINGIFLFILKKDYKNRILIFHLLLIILEILIFINWGYDINVFLK